MDGYNRGKPLTGLLGRTLPGSFFSGQPGPRPTYQQGPTRAGGVTGGNLLGRSVPGSVFTGHSQPNTYQPGFQRQSPYTNNLYNLLRRYKIGGF